jgi:hypothetical protein
LKKKYISNPKYFQNPIGSISGFSHLTLIGSISGSGSDWVTLSKNLVVVLSGIVGNSIRSDVTDLEKQRVNFIFRPYSLSTFGFSHTLEKML